MKKIVEIFFKIWDFLFWELKKLSENLQILSCPPLLGVVSSSVAPLDRVVLSTVGFKILARVLFIAVIREKYYFFFTSRFYLKWIKEKFTSMLTHHRYHFLIFKVIKFSVKSKIRLERNFQPGTMIMFSCIAHALFPLVNTNAYP